MLINGNEIKMASMTAGLKPMGHGCVLFETQSNHGYNEYTNVSKLSVIWLIRCYWKLFHLFLGELIGLEI